MGLNLEISGAHGHCTGAGSSGARGHLGLILGQSALGQNNDSKVIFTLGRVCTVKKYFQMFSPVNFAGGNVV